jgi:hypothetical protein
MASKKLQTLNAGAVLALAKKPPTIEIKDGDKVVGRVNLKAMKSGDMLRLIKAHRSDPDSATFEMVHQLVVDDDGQQMFTREEVEEIPFPIFAQLSIGVQKAFVGIGEEAEPGKGSATETPVSG